ncbi:MAG TPA: rhomboid family intramembrane serine protease [Terriglobales bacterium]|nr:rhomboid family intramembrane serine protease [Terriglobales bacterium]
MIPLGDTPNPRGVPVVTYALIGINIAAFVLYALPLGRLRPDPGDPALQEYLQILASELPNDVLRQMLEQISAYDIFVYLHGFKPNLPEASDLFASLFLHDNLAHLGGNMLFLWIYGDNVEHRLGRLRFLFSYLLCGVAATMFHAVFDLSSAMPLIGASGAISGVLGFYFKWFPHNKVRLLIFFFPILMETIYVPARLVLGMYFVIDNLLPFLAADTGRGGGVAYGAHLGGFLGGLALAFWWNRREIAGAPRDFPNQEFDIELEPGARSLNQLVEDGELAAAAEHYFALPAAQARGALTPRASIQLADWLRRAGHPHAALTVYLRHLHDYPRGPLRAAAHAGAGRIHLEEMNQPAPAYQHFLDALDSNPTPEIERLARHGLDVIANAQRPRFPRRH